MPQSLAKIYIHLIFSTKNGQQLIVSTIEGQLYKYMATVLISQGSMPVKIGGMPDHVHILTQMPKTQTVSKLVEEVKKRSSKWIKKKGAELEEFSWQQGYGVFSVSQSHLDAVEKYIVDQPKHHKKLSFKDEFLAFLKKFKVDFDEKFLWD